MIRRSKRQRSDDFLLFVSFLAIITATLLALKVEASVEKDRIVAFACSWENIEVIASVTVPAGQDAVSRGLVQDGVAYQLELSNFTKDSVNAEITRIGPPVRKYNVTCPLEVE